MMGTTVYEKCVWESRMTRSTVYGQWKKCLEIDNDENYNLQSTENMSGNQESQELQSTVKGKYV